VLSKEGLEHLARHEFHPGGNTPLDNRLTPVWQGWADKLPRWLAPNIVTLAGFTPMAVSYALAWRYSPGFAVSGPRWLAPFALLALGVYQTSDAVDGKHARGIGAATPVGQLFDHGFDCLAAITIHSMAMLVLLPGSSCWGLAGLAALLTGFFMAQWSERVMGVLPTSYGVIGVTEVQIALMLLLLLGGLAGPEKVGSLSSSIVQSPLGLGPVPMGVAACQVWSVFLGSIAATCGIQTMKHAASQKEAGKSIRAAGSDLLPVALLIVLLFSWEPSMLSRAPRLVSFTTGLLFFFYTVQMIVFTMAKMPFSAFQATLLPYAGLVLCSWLAPGQAHMLDVGLRVITAGMGVRVLVWLANAVGEMKVKLDINVLDLKKRSLTLVPLL